jgi:hypothetical protein
MLTNSLPACAPRFPEAIPAKEGPVIDPPKPLNPTPALTFPVLKDPPSVPSACPPIKPLPA